MRETFEKLPFLQTTRAAWQKAGDLSAGLRRKGITIPLSDLVIAASALQVGAAVYSLDPHFEKLPELKLHDLPAPL